MVQYKVSTYSAAFLINVELFFVVFIYFVELIDGYSSLSSAAGIRGWGIVFSFPHDVVVLLLIE